MRVLALDTSTRDGSAALLEDERVLVERLGSATRPQAERLPGELLDLLHDAGTRLADVDVFAIGAGPGSFTGLRIGIAAMQGLAVVCGRPMAAVSLLEALGQVAAATHAPGTTVGVWIDAYRREVFSALYRATTAAPYTPARLRDLEPAQVDRPDVTAARWRGLQPDLVIGNGAVLYAGLLDGLCPVLAPPPLAAAIGRLALAKARADETVAAGAVQPYYVRRPDVEIARERGRHG